MVAVVMTALAIGHDHILSLLSLYYPARGRTYDLDGGGAAADDHGSWVDSDSDQ